MVLTLESFDKLHCIKLTRNGPCASSNQGLYRENSPQNCNSVMINLLICCFKPARQIFFLWNTGREFLKNLLAALSYMSIV